MLNTNEKVNPAVLALVELGNGIGGTKVSGSTREEIGKNLRKAFLMSRNVQRRMSQPLDNPVQRQEISEVFLHDLFFEN